MSNNIMDNVVSKLGVELTTKSSYSPHQNGINERNHAIVDLMITHMISSDKTLSPDTALLWAVNAKNSLENHLGFSPFQLHIGSNQQCSLVVPVMALLRLRVLPTVKVLLNILMQ